MWRFFRADSTWLRTCPQLTQRPSTAKSPSYPKVIHRHRSVISLPNDASRDNVFPTDARHEPPGNGSQTTKQSAQALPGQGRPGKGGSRATIPAYTGVTRPILRWSRSLRQRRRSKASLNKWLDESMAGHRPKTFGQGYQPIRNPASAGFLFLARLSEVADVG